MKYYLRSLGILIQIISIFYSLGCLIGFIILLSRGDQSAFLILIAIVLLILLNLFGNWLRKKGQSNLRSYKTCMEISFKNIREKGYIDTLEISSKIRRSELEIREMIYKGQNKGMIPFSVEIK